MKAKYTNLINALDENTQESISFSDEKDMELLSILDNDKTKEWNYSKWVELMNKSVEEDNVTLMLGILNAKGIPNDIFRKLALSLPDEMVYMALMSKNITEEAYIDILDFFDYPDEFFFDIIREHGFHFNEKTIDMLCSEHPEDLAYIDFEPFKLAKGKEIEELIFDMLENTGDYYFEDGNIPEMFTSAIISNPNLSDDIKIKAFKCGYDPNLIIDSYRDNCKLPTEITTEIYRSCSELIFDIGAEDFSNEDKIIKQLISENNLPESCQKDFINRHLSTPNIQTNSLYQLLVSPNISPDLLVLASRINQQKVKNMILLNKINMNESLLNELSKSVPPLNLTTSYIYGILNHPIQNDVAQKFTKSTNEAVHFATIASIHSEEKTVEDIIKNCKNRKQKNEFEFLKDFKKIAKTYDDTQSKMMFVLNKILENKKLSSPESNALLDIANYHKSKWLITPQNEYFSLREKLENLKDTYSDFADVIKNISIHLDNTHNLYNFVIKYPKLFEINSIDDIQHNIGFDIDSLYEMNEKDMQNFIQDVKETNNKYLNNKIRGEILNFIEWNDLEFCYKAQAGIFRFADLFNVVDEQLKETLKETDNNLEEDEFYK